jgi:hypothetical protein
MFLRPITVALTAVFAGAQATAAPPAGEAKAELAEAAREVVRALKVGDVNALSERVGPQGLAIGSALSMGDTDKRWSRDELLAAWQSPKQRRWGYCGGCGGGPNEHPKTSVRGYFRAVVYSRDFLAARPKIFAPGEPMPHIKERGRGVWTVSYLHDPKSEGWRELDLHFKHSDGKWWLVEIQNREWEI